MKTFLMIVCLFLSTMISAQNVEFDQRLLEKFSQEELIDLKENSPDRYNTISYCLDHGYYFVDVPEKKNIKERISGEITINDINNFNFLLLDISFLENDYQYFKVKDLDKLLVVKSGTHIYEEMNK